MTLRVVLVVQVMMAKSVQSVMCDSDTVSVATLP
jgi:hypothetical protein